MGRFRRAMLALGSVAAIAGPAVLLAGLAAPAAAQVTEYEMRYGQVIEVSLDDLLQMPESYNGRAVRTHGQLEMEPSTGRMVYSLRGTFGGRLYLYPTAEAGADWERDARQWLGKEVEVTGAVGVGSAATSGQRAAYLLLWGFLGPPDEKRARADSKQVTLEDLVMKPAQHEGQTVTVKGQFRGANLYGDLPSASRQRSSDWVLKDDVFAVWVSGKKAKGEGWTLDTGLKRDTGKWLQVTGRVRVDRGVVTLQATDVVLSKPPTAARPAPVQAQAPPPAPPKPQKPPVVVFSLPLDGERDVPPNGVFQVQFSKDMDEQTFKDRVVFRYAGRPQPGDNALDATRVSYDLGRRTLQVDPGDLLRPGRVVELLLLPGIVDLEGLPLATRPGKNPGAATDVLRFQVASSGVVSGPLP
ncbi:MAG TPA: Ig-like domain-containing protein [Vicinamibacteria bacterium]|nr:Ig-like domain-containing protein [Vicinamibacteria bacterium]